MSGNKTEQPTPKRLRDARKKGQVAKSREVASSAVIAGLFAYIWLRWDFMFETAKEMVLLPASLYRTDFMKALEVLLKGIFIKMTLLVLPVVLIAMTCALVANLFQVAILFAFEPVKPDLKKIDPMQGIKKIFSKNNFMELLKSSVKIAFLGFLVFSIIKGAIRPLVELPCLGPGGVPVLLQALTKKLAIYGLGAFVLVAVADFFWQRHSHMKKLMMTKDEVKQEYKEMEGDPIIKSRRRQLHKEMVMNDTIQRARKATVIITNPTRLAVALFYDKEKTKLPVVISKGQDFVARKILEVAEEEGIPVMQNVPLAHSLYEDVEIDKYIPSDLIEPVAEVLRWVQQIKEGRG